jgi:transposase-like protein
MYSHLRDESYQLDSLCPLAPTADRYHIHEDTKRRSGSSWQCGHCAKQFVSESYLDRHLDAKHMNTIPKVRFACVMAVTLFALFMR